MNFSLDWPAICIPFAFKENYIVVNADFAVFHDVMVIWNQ